MSEPRENFLGCVHAPESAPHTWCWPCLTACVQQAIRPLQELVAGAHALRCACAGHGPLRDPRCAELQGMAGD